jgi:hypothetical protein
LSQLTIARAGVLHVSIAKSRAEARRCAILVRL